MAQQNVTDSLPPAPVLLRTALPPVPGTARITGAFAHDRLGLFCKAEYHLHQWLPIPVLIRIGDVERDEEVDGKGAYGREQR